MSCLINFPYRLIQYYGILFGFSYAFYDIENRIVKYFKYLKCYVYFINLLYAALSLHFSIYYTLLLINNIYNPVEEYMIIITYICSILIFIFLIRLRWKEENTLKRWQKIFAALQIKYFDEQTCVSADSTLELFKIFNILIIFLQTCYTIFRIISMNNKEWHNLTQCFLANVFLAMINYVMLRHSFVLCYINNCFSKIDKLLKNEGINYRLIYIYYKLSKLLQHVNSINGPIIFTVFIYQVIEIGIQLQYLFDLLLNIDIIGYAEYVDIFIILILPLNICLYFFISDRLYRTTSDENTKMFMEYAVGKQDQEVYLWISYKKN